MADIMDLGAYLASFGEVEIVPVSKVQRVVGSRLAASRDQVVQVTHHDEVDATALEAYRATLPREARVSPLIFIAKALVSALKTFPQFNVSLSEDGQQLIRKHYFNIGFAVDAPSGLLVPVLREADKKDVTALAAELHEFTLNAREKGLPLNVMEGGCMTISSLGGIGGTAFTPIVNLPEVAILGVLPIRTIPRWNGNSFEPRPVLPLSLSYDHRIINGADAARFVRHIGTALADPAAL